MERLTQSDIERVQADLHPACSVSVPVRENRIDRGRVRAPSGHFCRTHARLASLLVFIVACSARSPVEVATAGHHEPKPTASAVAKSQNEREENTSVSQTQGFTIDYTVVGGPELGVGIREQDRRLTVDGAAGSAKLVSVRAGGDKPGAPIGTFAMQLDDAELAKLSSVATSIDRSNLPPPSGGGPGTSTITLGFRSATESWDHAVNSLDRSGVAVFRDLFQPLNQLMGRLHAHPEEALRLEVEHDSAGRFVLRLHNIGQSELAVLDPSTLGTDGGRAWAGVQVSPFPEARPGVTPAPLQWERVGLEAAGSSPSGTGRTSTVVPAGHSAEWKTTSWTPRASGRHLVQAVVLDYAGPDRVDGRSRIRGALFSEGVEFTP
jgi:hypothetical protein